MSLTPPRRPRLAPPKPRSAADRVGVGGRSWSSRKPPLLRNPIRLPTIQNTVARGPMPLYSPLSGPVVVVPGSALDREDGRFQVEFEHLGGAALVRSAAAHPYVCSVTGIPHPEGTPVLKPSAPHPALVGICISEQGWDLLTETEDPTALMLWPQNAPDYRPPSTEA